MRISDWSSDVCSSDLEDQQEAHVVGVWQGEERTVEGGEQQRHRRRQQGQQQRAGTEFQRGDRQRLAALDEALVERAEDRHQPRSEEHTSELQSPMRTSYAVFCLKKKKEHNTHNA